MSVGVGNGEDVMVGVGDDVSVGVGRGGDVICLLYTSDAADE